jgi:DNA processing protein
MKNLRYWIWFTESIGYCTVKAKQITQLYDSIEEFYSGGEKEWRFSGLFSDSEINKLKENSLADADKIISKCSNLYYETITLDDYNYPVCLKSIDDPPAVLYVSGMLPDIDDRLSIAVVGTRRVSKYGKSCSYDFANKLASVGVTIVSGGALGVDCASHYGALSADGVTICVLGCGINYQYLMENAKMRSDITFKGAVVSEYPPDTPPYPFHFPQRNRIISALSDGILLIEAGKKSGSLITVNTALEQDCEKKIFALAGTNDPRFDGSNDLIKNGIALLVTDYKDVLNSFNNLYATQELDRAIPYDEIIDVIPVKGKAPEKVEGFNVNDLSDVPVHKENPDLNDIEKQIYYAINSDPVHIDTLSEVTGLPVFKLLPSLTVLEVKGYVKCVQGRSYILK